MVSPDIPDEEGSILYCLDNLSAQIQIATTDTLHMQAICTLHFKRLINSD